MSTDIIKIKECTGYTKEEAFAGLRFDPNNPLIKGANATQAWVQAGKPTINTNAFKHFVAQQLADKTKYKPGYGIHIVIEPNTEDKRKRPYTIINNKTVGTREWKFMYQIREDILDISYFGDVEDEEIDMDQLEISVIERGMVVEECESKAEALDKVKQLITQTHKSYSIIPIKVPNIAPISAFGVYTPSKNAKKGIFIACGVNTEIDD